MDSGSGRVLVLSSALRRDIIPGAEEHGVGDVEGAWSKMCSCQHLFAARLGGREGRQRREGEQGSGCRCWWRREGSSERRWR